MSLFSTFIRQLSAISAAENEFSNKIEAAAFSELSDAVMHEDR
tara:strand:+ start:3814 stop:3942 length:129 start_codon:yes stop_codon:yes gene_type:complete